MSLVTAFEPEADLGDQRGSGTASQLLQVVLVLVAVGLGVVVTRWTHGADRSRRDVVMLTTLGGQRVGAGRDAGGQVSPRSQATAWVAS